MSRTYRSREYVEHDCNCGCPIAPRFTYNKGRCHESVQEEINTSRRKAVLPNRTCDCNTWHCDNHKRNYKRDRKEYYKPNKVYKKITKKIRKAKERSAMAKKDYDNIPKFRKSDAWNYY